MWQIRLHFGLVGSVFILAFIPLFTSVFLLRRLSYRRAPNVFCLSDAPWAHKRLLTLFRFFLLVPNALPGSPTALVVCSELQNLNSRSLRNL